MRKLETKKLVIREFKKEDAKEAYELWAKEEKIAETADFKAHKSIKETEKIIESFKNEDENERRTYAIEVKLEKRIIGFVRVFNISVKNKNCELLWVVGENYKNNGYEEETINRVIDHLYRKNGFKVFKSLFYGENSYKEKILTNIKMVKEAELRKRKVNRYTGERENLNIYSLIKE